MVGLGWARLAHLMAQQPPPLVRMDGATRAKVLATLAGLLILGVGLMILTWMAARLTRRYMRLGDKSSPAPTRNDEDWVTPTTKDDEAT